MSDAALERLEERFDADPGDAAAFEALEERHFLRGDWPRLVALYERRLDAPDLDPERGRAPRARLLLRLGQVLEERCQDPEAATTRYEEAVRLEPTGRAALAQLRGLYSRRGRWELALQVAELEGRLPMRPFEEAAFATELGQTWLEKLDDPTQAAAHFERALGASPDHLDALLGAARARTCLGETGRAEAHLRHAAAVAQGPDRAPVWVALARLLEGPLADPEEAAACHRRALEDDPRCAPALEALVESARRGEDWETLDALCERRFDLASGAVRRLAIAHDAARVQLERRRDPRAARHWLERAAALFPEDPVVHLLLADVERLTGNGEALAGHLRRAAQLAGDATPVELLRESAELALAAGDDELAATELRRALARAPDDRDMQGALAGALERLGRHGELAGILEQHVALTRDGTPARAEALLRLGRFLLERGDEEAGLDAFARAAEADPTSPEALDGACELYRKADAGDALRSLLERAAAHPGQSTARAVELHCRLGALLMERFDDAEAARRAFDGALALDPDAAAAREGLEHIALASGDEDTVLAAFEREAAVTGDRQRLAFLCRELVRLHESRDAPERALAWVRKLADALPEDRAALETRARLEEALGEEEALARTLARLDVLLSGDERARNRRRRAALLEKAGETEAAAEAWREALAADPDDVESLRALSALLAGRDADAELVDVLQRLAERLTGAESARCRCRVSELLEHGDDLAGAIAELERAVDVPGAPEDAAERLEALLERAGRHEALEARLARRRAALADDAPEAGDLDLRRGRIWLDRLRRPDRAVPCFRAARAARPDWTVARDELERALRAANDAEGLAAILAERAGAETDPERRAALELERAELALACEGREDEARALLESIAAAGGPEASRAASLLDDLLERRGDWSALRERWVARLEMASGEEVLALRLRLAGLCRDRLADPEAATVHLEAAAEEAPGRSDLWQALARLHRDAGRSADEVRVLEAELATGPPPDRAHVLHARAAECCRDALGDPARAAEHFSRLLELDPAHDEAAEFLMERLAAEDRSEELARVLALRLAAQATPPGAAGAVSLRLRLAALRAEKLDDAEGAIRALEPAAEDPEALLLVAEPLADLYQREGRRERLVSLVRRAADACEAPGERAGWCLRLGDALRSGGDAEGAAEAYRRVLVDRSDDRAARAALRDLYRERGEAAPLARLLESELAALGGPAELPFRLELAGLLEGELERPAEALNHLRRVLQLEPGHAEALARALTLAERLELDADWLALSEEALAHARGPRERADWLVRRGARLEGAAALESFREALALDPTRAEAREAVIALCECAGDWEAVLGALESEWEARSREPERAAAVCERAARIATEHVHADAALPWLLRLRALHPDDPAVPARLAEIHRVAGRAAPLLRALEDEIALGPPPERRVALEQERAHWLETALGAPGRAIAALEAARRCDPEAAGVLRELARLYGETGRTREHAEVLEALAARAEGPERLERLRKAAEAHRTRGDLRGSAARLWEALGCEPSAVDRAELLRALGAVLTGLGRPDHAARVAEEELRALDPDAPVFRERRRELHRELARLHGRELGRPAEARRHWRALLDADRLEPEDARLRDEAERELLGSLRAARSPVELEARLSARLAGGRDDAHPEEVDAWLELGRLRGEALHRPAAAAEAFRQALARDPSCLPALRGLRAACERLGQPEEVARTLEAEAALSDTRPPAQRAALYRRLGLVTWRQLDATPRASRAFAAALEADPRDLVSLRALQALLESVEDHRGALDLYESEVSVLGEAEPGRRQAVWLRVGELARDAEDDAARALRAYEAAAAIGALPLARRAEWAELYARLGPPERFAEVFADWCDAAGSPAGAADALRLARALVALGRDAEALARVEEALERAPHDAEAWDLAAQLHEAAGRAGDAAEALERGADRRAGAAAARRRLRAAELVEEADPERAAATLERASADDPTSALAPARHAALCAQLGRGEATLRAARETLARVALGAPLDDELRLETALAGARAARERDEKEAAAPLLAEALAVAPDHAEALAAQGEVLFALSDWPGARRALEARLALDEPDPERSLHLARLGAALDASGDGRAALARYREALAADPSLDEAHAGLTARLERDGQRAEAVAALRAWAAESRDPTARSARLLRAAELELAAGRRDPAEGLLREATDADPDAARAWARLATLLWDAERPDEAFEVAERGTATDPGDAATRGVLALVRGRALEARGEHRAAAEAYAEAADADPARSEAALSGARLLRGLGEWRRAAGLLAGFVEAADALAESGADTVPVAPALHQLGRLLAGPLEDLEGAIDAYRRALDAEPDREDVREALAELLAHRPDHWEEAVTRHRELLERDPVRVGSLRALLRIARGRSRSGAVATGLCVLRALGVATPEERAEAPDRPPLGAGAAAGFERPDWECARSVAHAAAGEIAEALGVGAHAAPEAPRDDRDPVARFRAAVTGVEGELAAPALVPLPTDEVGQAILLVAQLAADVEVVRGDGLLVNALAAAFGRRARRRVRRLLPETGVGELAAIDFAAWRAELRGIASAAALDATDVPLRAALLAWLDGDGADAPRRLPDEVDVSARVAASPEARALLRRITRVWIDAL